MALGHQDFTQKKPDQLVYLELGVGNGGMLLMISEDGFRFRAVTPVRANTSMPFAFSLDGRNRLEGEGTVEWVEEDGKSGGMRFTEVSPEFHATLGAWLNSDVSHQAGREVTPAAATPLDTMEKIRQELRAGYPTRPAEVTPTVKASEQKPEARIFPSATSDKNVFEKSRLDKNSPEQNVPPQKPKPTIFARTPGKISDSKEPSTSSRLFPLSSARATTPEKSAMVSSAFLKPAGEAKAPVVSPAPVIPAKPVESAPTKREVPNAAASSALFRTAPKPAETHVVAEIPAAEPLVATETFAAHARPFIPPLEESFEQAWERAKLTSPPDSPHLSRTAAGSIIAIALAIILGALGYNFRQDIGSIFIQLGQSISGENRPAAPAAPAPSPETKPDTTPSTEANQTTSPPAPSQSVTSQPQDAPAELGNAGKSSASSANKNLAAGAATTTPGASGTKSGAALPPVVKVPENSAPSVAADPAAKTGVAADSGIGQEEFAAAQDVLRGGNRQRDLSRAVALLWSSVKKGYVPAEVRLADLYRRGDGVEKNCDQARVLLVAASKKGSFEARQVLEQIAEQGCE
jgi:localization factor PodJL